MFKQSFNLRIHERFQLGSLLNYEPEVLAYATGLITPLSLSQKTRLNTRVKSMKTRLGVSALSEILDVFYFGAGETAESSLKNIVKDAHHCTSTAMPTFTAFKGFKGDKISQYLDTNYNPSTALRYKQDDASMGGYTSQQDSNTTLPAVIWGCEDAIRYIRFLPARTTSGVHWILNSALSVPTLSESLSSPDRALHIQNRVASGEARMYKNGSLYHTHSISSNGIPNGNIYLLARNNIGVGASLFSDARISCWFAGKGLTDLQIAIINDEVEMYMQSINNAFQVKITQPTVIFSFDDGNAEHVNLTKSVFDAVGKKCTHFITTDFIGTAGFMSVENLQTLHAAGYDLQCHSKDHANLTTLTEAQLISNFQAVNDFFTANSLPVPKHHAYPGGANGTGVLLNVVARFRQSARQIGNINAYYSGYIQNMCRVSTARSVDGATNDTIFRAGIDLAKANNGLVIYYAHGVYENDPAESAYPNPIKASALSAALNYAIANGVAVKTISEVFETDY